MTSEPDTPPEPDMPAPKVAAAARRGPRRAAVGLLSLALLGLLLLGGGLGLVVLRNAPLVGWFFSLWPELTPISFRATQTSALAVIIMVTWQWTPFVPHDPEGLAKLMGGKEAFGEWLDKLFSTKSKVSGENSSGDITGLIGQYAHGNEPSHHIPYLYQFTDRPWRTQEVLDFILTSFFRLYKLIPFSFLLI